MINLFRIQSKIYRTIGNLIGYRPDSDPYISGDGFRAMAHHIYDETGKCCAADIQERDIVFVKTDMMTGWFKDVHPFVMHPYTLITHNSDGIVGEKEAAYIDDKIIRWFAQNNTFKHPRIIPIPIGIENKKWFLSGWILMKKVKSLKAQNQQKNKRILVGFTVNTNVTERTTALEALRRCAIADEIKERINPEEYFNLLNKYGFVASPEGNGPDCIRTWEAIILGIVPIVRDVSNDQLLSQNSLPILIVKDWEHLEEECARYTTDVKSDIIMLNYWKKILQNNE